MARDGGTLLIDFVPPADQQAGLPAEQRWSIFLEGPIDEGAAERFAEEVASRQIESANVLLNSPGGLLLEGMALGRELRQRGFSTVVARRNEESSGTLLPGSCYSACVFAFLGGAYRFAPPQSRIGVHRFSSLSADADPDVVQRVSATVMRYIREMGADVDLFERMSRKGKEQILVLGKDDLERLRVVNNGRLNAEWGIEAEGGALHLKGAQRTSQGYGEVQLSCNDGRVMFQAAFDAGERAEEIVNYAARHSMRFGDGFVPLPEPVQPLSAHNGQVSGLFALEADQLKSLRSSGSIGYAVHSASAGTLGGFSVDTSGRGIESIRNFLSSCPAP